ncbi:hypothetical protein GWK47_024735 [Chionoecetes opilio]|uniref:HAT C-terminal dimerisation domain-containing protein n=1 Tax=Chionoecetes opilio TaxID=41210 RepID=A0A8J5CJ42_CHIOP|nr:hypothetical protein GWK47_024735 [Chionoecetes opilio]
MFEACELMKALQALNPQSTEFLSFEKISGLIHAFRANEEDLNHELNSAKRMLERCYKDVSDNEKSKSLLDLVRILGPYEEAFPEFYRLAKISVVLSVSSASAEGSFSALKLIKTTLRNTMGNERLGNLAALSIESRRVKSLDLEVFVDKFAENHKNRRILLQ